MKRAATAAKSEEHAKRRRTSVVVEIDDLPDYAHAIAELRGWLAQAQCETRLCGACARVAREADAADWVACGNCGCALCATCVEEADDSFSDDEATTGDEGGGGGARAVHAHLCSDCADDDYSDISVSSDESCASESESDA